LICFGESLGSWTLGGGTPPPGLLACDGKSERNNFAMPGRLCSDVLFHAAEADWGTKAAKQKRAMQAAPVRELVFISVSFAFERCPADICPFVARPPENAF
jgi:hypothetical protein